MPPGLGGVTLDYLTRETRFSLTVECSLDGRRRKGPHRHVPAFAPATRALVYRIAKRDLLSRALVGRPHLAAHAYGLGRL
jgi:hypothetical protein